LAIPDFTVVDDSFIVYPCIEWETLNNCEVIYSDEFVSTLVWFIKELHSIPLDKFDFLQSNDESPDEFHAWVQSLKDDVSVRLGWKVSSETIIKLLDYIQQLFINYQSPIKAFTHSDLQWKNIIYSQKDQQIAWIIDFTGARIWWVELDFCHFAYRDDDLLERMVIAYLWQMDQSFIERIKFLAKRTIIRQIKNDGLYYNDFDLILDQLRRYEFL
jgi:aminoglycoside phosphotransferase (APT) family kinase protein